MLSVKSGVGFNKRHDLTMKLLYFLSYYYSLYYTFHNVIKNSILHSLHYDYKNKFTFMCVLEFKFLNNYLSEAQLSREFLKSELNQFYHNHNTFLGSVYSFNFCIFNNNIELTLYYLVSTKMSHILKKSCTFPLQVCLSVHDLFVGTRH